MTTSIIAAAVIILAAYALIIMNDFSIKEYLKALREDNEEKEDEKPVEKPGYSFEEGIQKFSHLPYTKNLDGDFTEEVVIHTRNNRK